MAVRTVRYVGHLAGTDTSGIVQRTAVRTYSTGTFYTFLPRSVLQVLYLFPTLIYSFFSYLSNNCYRYGTRKLNPSSPVGSGSHNFLP
jgi:hypothetical protein